jgi:hypothetical protein
MFGLAPWIIIAWLITAAGVPVAYEAGHLLGAQSQAATDRVQEKVDQLAAAKAALEKQRDDSATITLHQIEATQREREARIALQTEAQRLEDEAREQDRKLQDAASFVCPPVVPTTTGPVAQAPHCPVCGYDDDELARLLRRYSPGPIPVRRAQHPTSPR